MASLRVHVVDKILTLHCPRCDQAFVDFTGCFALRCGRCNAGFCAWCLALCGTDAHTHVAACGEKRSAGGAEGSFFGTEAQFAAAQKARRAAMLREYLDRQSPAVRGPLLSALKKDLSDIGMDARDFG